MTVVQSGSINTTALAVPDLYVQIVPPQNAYINGVPTNIFGLVGTATWGAVNSPTIVGNLNQYVLNFGSIQTNKYDMGTHVAVASLQGASNFRCVRVTDGTDTAASKAIVDTQGTPVTGLTLTAFYTGITGNSLVATVSQGSSYNSVNPTFKLTIVMPNGVPEVYDNIGGTGLAFWQNMVNAVNLGLSNIRGPSQLCVATIGTSTNLPALATYTLTGGTNGNTTITSSVLIGQDTVPRKGMYALRNTGTSIASLCDCDDSTTYSTQIAYGLSEGTYMMMIGPVGQSISAAITAKQTAGIDSFSAKLLLGDWLYWKDTYNNQLRLVSPQAAVGGLLSNLSPQFSSLNKQIQGIVGTQKSYANQTYSSADLQSLAGAGIDVIANPCPGGQYFGVRLGRNASSNAVTHGDNYTRMTNYIAYTLNSAMGMYVGRLQTVTQRLNAKNTIQTFLSNMEQQNMIGDVNGGPSYSVVLDSSNNPSSRVALGYMQSDVKVIYLSVIEYFLINVEGGQSVTIQRQATIGNQ